MPNVLKERDKAVCALCEVGLVCGSKLVWCTNYAAHSGLNDDIGLLWISISVESQWHPLTLSGLHTLSPVWTHDYDAGIFRQISQKKLPTKFKRNIYINLDKI